MQNSTGIQYVLKIFNSRADVSGNRYWAFSMNEIATGKVVSAYVPMSCGSNIEAVRLHWHNTETWDKSVMCVSEEMKIRDFNRFANSLPRLPLCHQEEIANYIKAELEKMPL